MSRPKQEKYIIITAKTERGKKRISYHGERWLYKGMMPSLQFVRQPGPYLKVVSRNGEALLFINQKNDPDFEFRLL